MKPGAAEGHCLQVETDRFEGPAIDQLAALRLKRVPEVSDELDEAPPAGLLPAQLVEVPMCLLAFECF
jgi:hypothetical protein